MSDSSRGPNVTVIAVLLAVGAILVGAGGYIVGAKSGEDVDAAVSSARERGQEPEPWPASVEGEPKEPKRGKALTRRPINAPSIARTKRHWLPGIEGW